jgi:hypothetical protein
MSLKETINRKFRNFPTKIHIAVQRGDHVVWVTDSLMRIEEEGQEYYLMKRAGRHIKPEEYSTIGSDDKGKPIMFSYNPAPDIYVPFTFKFGIGDKKEDGKFKDVIASIELDDNMEARKIWKDNEYRRTWIKYPKSQGTLEKLIPFLLIMALGLSLFMIFTGFNKLQTTLSEFQVTVGEQMLTAQKQTNEGLMIITNVLDDGTIRTINQPSY